MVKIIEPNDLPELLNEHAPVQALRVEHRFFMTPDKPVEVITTGPLLYKNVPAGTPLELRVLAFREITTPALLAERWNVLTISPDPFHMIQGYGPVHDLTEKGPELAEAFAHRTRHDGTIPIDPPTPLGSFRSLAREILENPALVQKAAQISTFCQRGVEQEKREKQTRDVLHWIAETAARHTLPLEPVFVLRFPEEVLIRNEGSNGSMSLRSSIFVLDIGADGKPVFPQQGNEYRIAHENDFTNSEPRYVLPEGLTFATIPAIKLPEEAPADAPATPKPRKSLFSRLFHRDR